MVSDGAAIPERHEYYKAHGVTIELSTCDCCHSKGFQDGWVVKNGSRFHSSFRRQMAGYTLITEKEARRRAPKLFE